MEENDLVHSDPLSSFGTQIFSSLLWKRKRKKGLGLPRLGFCFVLFFNSPTTSLLPPSESFRTEKRPFTGEDLGVGGEKKLDLHRLTNFSREIVCLSVSDEIDP